MSRVGFIWVGKPKEKFYREGCEHYWKKLARFYKLEESMIKDGPGKLPPADRNRKEGEGILAKAKPSDLLIIMDEFGDRLTSTKLADRMRRWIEDPNLRPTFVIGGPFGLSEEVKTAARVKLRLSDMTLPHELARLVLLEQLYRAGSILRGMPYHHE